MQLTPTSYKQEASFRLLVSLVRKYGSWLPAGFRPYAGLVTEQCLTASVNATTTVEPFNDAEYE
jgi:hypothetical protein